jgi:hypothetical protein
MEEVIVVVIHDQPQELLLALSTIQDTSEYHNYFVQIVQELLLCRGSILLERNVLLLVLSKMVDERGQSNSQVQMLPIRTTFCSDLLPINSFYTTTQFFDKVVQAFA